MGPDRLGRRRQPDRQAGQGGDGHGANAQSRAQPRPPLPEATGQGPDHGPTLPPPVREPADAPARRAVREGKLDLRHTGSGPHRVDAEGRLDSEAGGQGQQSAQQGPVHGALSRQGGPGPPPGGPPHAPRRQPAHRSQPSGRAGRRQDGHGHARLAAQNGGQQAHRGRRAGTEVPVHQQVGPGVGGGADTRGQSASLPAVAGQAQHVGACPGRGRGGAVPGAVVDDDDPVDSSGRVQGGHGRPHRVGPLEGGDHGDHRPGPGLAPGGGRPARPVAGGHVHSPSGPPAEPSEAGTAASSPSSPGLGARSSPRRSRISPAATTR